MVICMPCCYVYYPILLKNHEAKSSDMFSFSRRGALLLGKVVVCWGFPDRQWAEWALSLPIPFSWTECRQVCVKLLLCWNFTLHWTGFEIQRRWRGLGLCVFPCDGPWRQRWGDNTICIHVMNMLGGYEYAKCRERTPGRDLDEML